MSKNLRNKDNSEMKSSPKNNHEEKVRFSRVKEAHIVDPRNDFTSPLELNLSHVEESYVNDYQEEDVFKIS